MLSQYTRLDIIYTLKPEYKKSYTSQYDKRDYRYFMEQLEFQLQRGYSLSGGNKTLRDYATVSCKKRV